MFRISNTIPELLAVLKRGDPITVRSGSWKRAHPWINWLRSLFSLDILPLIYLAQHLVHLLEMFEKSTLVLPINPENTTTQTAHIHQARLYLELGSWVTSKIHSHPKAKNLKTLLSRHLVGLEYRLEENYGGIDCLKSSTLYFQELKDRALEWKKKQVLFYRKDLNSTEIKKIKETALYEKFLFLLKTDPRLEDQFWSWTLRDHNAVGPFIQYPAMQIKLVDSNINGRIGKIQGGQLLKIKKKNFSDRIEKTLTLPFEGKDLSILNEEALIHFKRGNYTLRLKEIWKIFKKKFHKVGNLEFLNQGIVNWNTLKLGHWDAAKKKYQSINLNRRDWWRELPLGEIITLKQARKRYGWHLDGYRWNMAASASRGRPTLDYEETHAYLEIAIPLSKGRYAIYDFGKVATFFPSNGLETLKIFCLNLFATIAYPDDNIFYSHRQHVHHSFPLLPAQGEKMMNLIRRDMVKGRAKNFVYQIESENCAEWVYEIITSVMGKGNVPNLFKMKLLHTEPKGPAAFLFNLIKKLPEELQTSVITALHLPLGAWIGTWIVENGRKVKKAMIHHPFWKTAEVYLPALLHHLKEKGKLATRFIQKLIYQRKVHKRKSYLKNYLFLDSESPPLIFINLMEKSIILTK